MQIQGLNNTNFKGGFNFPQMPKSSRKDLDTLINRGKQIFDDFGNKGDVFLVVRDKLDKRVASFIIEKGLNFEYFPKINTNARLDNEIPETLSNIIINQRGQKGNVMDLVRAADIARKKEQLSQKPKSYIENIISSLKLELNSPKKTKKFGALKITDNVVGKTIIISPSSPNNIHYVIVNSDKSTSSMEMSQRYAMKEDGTIVKIFRTVDELIDFRSRFKSTLSK